MRRSSTVRSMILTAAVAACSPEASMPDLRGTVLRVEYPDPAMQALALVHVRRTPGSAAGAASESTLVKLTGTSNVYHARGGDETRTDYRALEAGQLLDVWFAETNPETNPTWHQARTIRIRQGS